MLKDVFFTALNIDELRDILIKVIREHGEMLPSNKDNAKEIEPVLLTQKEVLTLLKITLPTLLSWRKLGIVKAIKINRSVRYNKADIDKLLKNLHQVKYSRNQGGVGL